MNKELNLFQKIKFKMHSGGYSDFKLECDALTQQDYATLAFLVSRKIQFKKCYGIPRGGLAFANALKQYENPSAKTILIVDDVVTTGKSFIDFKNELIATNKDIIADDIIGIAVFVRGNCPSFVTPIFTLNKIFWQND